MPKLLGLDKNGNLVGTVGDIACWSFQSAKQLTCGDGGILSTNDKKIGSFIEFWKWHKSIRFNRTFNKIN